MTIIVLSDNSTYDSRATVKRLTPEGAEALDTAGDAKVLDDTHVVEEVSLADLLALWNERHGTDY